MVVKYNSPTPTFWNCIGIAIAILSVGASWNISRTKVLEIELAHYKLKTGSAISKVQRVSQTLEQVSEKNQLNKTSRKMIDEELQQSNKILEKAQADIDSSTGELIEEEYKK